MAVIVEEKKSDVSYEEIRGIMARAHAPLIKKGLVMGSSQLSAAELEAKVGPEGKCFVALEDGIIVGTASCVPKKTKHWFFTGETMNVIHVAVPPEHKGKHIGALLLSALEEEAKRRGYTTMFLDTPEENTPMLTMIQKMGYRIVGAFAPKNPHYSVVAMKWLNGCPFPRILCALMYQGKRLYIRIKYKPGHVKRFRF